jgi:biopolymer transport protein ExbD
MPRVKVPRKSTSVDMTAMCDVAFLLLTFFILTATARQPDPLDIKTPSSTVQFKVPDKDLAILSMVERKSVHRNHWSGCKRLALQKMGALYSTTFTEARSKSFRSNVCFRSANVTQLKQYIINMSPEERKKVEKF